MKSINFEKIKRENRERIDSYKMKRNNKKIKKKNIVNKEKKKTKKFRFWYWLLNLVVIFAIACLCGVAGFFYYIVKTAPEFTKEKLYEKEASRIFDSQLNLIATLGVEQREKLTYDELPQVLVDAVVATEDSRFFQHNGLDVARFVKASIGQVLGQDAGGASTLTMQLSKLAFTSTDSEGFKGIIRKFTDIYMAVFKIEKNYTKEEIIEFYINTPCLGGSIYGVEQAAQYYFNKKASDLNLVESAMIAGMFQSPNGYNPYVYPEDANSRKNTVLYLMKRHGYINETEYDAAVKIDIKTLVKDGTTSTNEYQGFIDTVVQEVIDKTGNNPYDIPMDIYSTMVPAKQNVINNFYKTYKFKDKKVEVGIGLIDNKTGAILAVGAGRYKNNAMTLNYATQINRHPGSTIKPIIDYGPAIEYENLSSYGPFADEKTKYAGGYMNNYNFSYSGIQTMRTCLVKSMNTCALQAFKLTNNEQKLSFITSLGIQPEDGTSVLSQAYSIGAFNGLNPVQLAAAYAAFGSGGYYTSPYSFTKLVYRDSAEEFVQDVSRTRVMKAQTAYILSSVLQGVTSYKVKVSGTQIATKTGTSSYDQTLLKKYKLTSSVIPDSWVVSYSPDYALAIWYGYDSLDEEHAKNKWYLIMSQASAARTNMQAALVNKIFEKNSKFKNPGGVVSASVELETNPPQKPSANTPDSLKGTFLFISGTEPSETSTRFSTLSDPTSLTYSLNGKSLSLSWNSPGTPSAIDSEYLTSYFKNSFEEWADKFLKERLAYNKKSIGNFGFSIYLTSGTSSKYVGWTDQTSYTIDLNNYTGIYDGVIVKSSYSLFTKNASPGTKVVFQTASEGNFSVSMIGLTGSLHVGDSYTELNTSAVSSITYNSIEIKSSVSNLEVVTASIKKVGGSTNLTPSQITESTGTYNIVYNVSFSYLGTPVTRSFTQTIVVNS
ncbi:MAG: hypothetical protein GX758_01645 [Tenericutes bacterium]|nr:hypothetical protein [Mycoplasmatota bacterium]